MAIKNQTLRWTSAALEIFMFCGFILGWHMLQNVFVDEGFFCASSGQPLNVSTNGNEDCDKQFQSSSMINTFSYSVSVMPVSAFIFGMITPKLGTVNTRFLLQAIWATGLGFFIIAQPGSSDYLITIGCCLLSSSGLNLAIGNYPSSHLSGDKHGTVLSILCGAFDESSALGLVLYTMYGAVGRQVTFTVLLLLSGFMTLRSLTLMPKSIFPAHPPAGYQVDTLCCNGEVDDGYLKGDNVEKKDLDELELLESEKHQPLSASLTNPLYISVCTFFCCQTLRCYYFLARSHDWLHNMLHEHGREEESAYWGQVFGYFLMAAIFVAPFSGVVIDKSMAYFASKSNVNAAHGTLTVHCGLTALFGVFYSLTAYSNIPELQYVTFFLFVFHRSFTFAGAAAYVGMLFPSPLFHNLFGLLNFSSLWTGFGTQIFEGLFGWSIDQANLFLAALLCLSLAHPVLTFMKGRSKL